MGSVTKWKWQYIVSKLEKIRIESIQSEHDRLKNNRKHSLETWVAITKIWHLYQTTRRRGKEETEVESVFKVIIAKTSKIVERHKPTLSRS